MWRDEVISQVLEWSMSMANLRQSFLSAGVDADAVLRNISSPLPAHEMYCHVGLPTIVTDTIVATMNEGRVSESHNAQSKSKNAN